MNGRRWTVARFDVSQDAAYAERLAEHPDIALVTMARGDPEDVILAALRSAQVYQISAAKDELPRRWFADAALLARLPNLLAVSSTGAGFDTVDAPACTAAGVIVLNQAGSNAPAVAEHTLGMMLDLAKRITESDRRLRRDRGFARESLMGREIGGKTLGIVGIGHVGRRVAALARAFGMDVLAHDPLVEDAEVVRRGGEPLPLEALLARSDYVSVHCPRDPSTLRMFGAARFAAMKRGAVFLTTARGGIHDEGALLDALRSGHLGGAGLDVWEVEPPPLDHPLLQLENVIATFHTAGVTAESRRAMAEYAAEGVIHAIRGERPARLVNPEVWPTFLRRRAAVAEGRAA